MKYKPTLRVQHNQLSQDQNRLLMTVNKINKCTPDPYWPHAANTSHVCRIKRAKVNEERAKSKMCLNILSKGKTTNGLGTYDS